MAVSVGLRDLSRSADPMLGEAAVAAMTKLLQVMPSALRERVDTLGEVTVRVGRVAPPRRRRARPTDITILLALAQACRRQDRLRFDYRTGDDRTGRRHVEPHRLVSLRNRWYLVAFDLDRDDWRTFRIDRIDRPGPDRRPQRPPGRARAAALVAEGVAVRAYETQVRVRFPVPPGDRRRGDRADRSASSSPARPTPRARSSSSAATPTGSPATSPASRSRSRSSTPPRSAASSRCSPTACCAVTGSP